MATSSPATSDEMLVAYGGADPPFPGRAILANRPGHSAGVWFSWGVFMWFFAWQKEGYTITAALIASSVAGLLSGVMATGSHFYRRKAKEPTGWKRL